MEKKYTIGKKYVIDEEKALKFDMEIAKNFQKDRLKGCTKLKNIISKQSAIRKMK